MPTSKIEFLLSTREQHDLFGDFLPESTPDETTARWSHTDVWAQASGRHGRVRSRRVDRTSPPSSTTGSGESCCCTRRADRPTATPAADLAEEQRQSIERWYFTCPPELHREIIDALLADPSFRTRYDGLATGTAEFIRTAVHANAARAGAE